MPDSSGKTMTLQKKSKEISVQELARHIEALMEEDCAFTLLVTGYSMIPTLRHKRDQVVLVSPQRRSPRSGEIVFFRRRDDSCVLHRVFREFEVDRFLINGDAQLWTEVIHRDQIIAVVDRLIRNQKIISCDNRYYCLYVKIWCKLRPLRRFIFRAYKLMVKFISPRRKKSCDS